MRGRSLARRFRGSVRATLCVALPERTGRARVSGRTLGGLRSECSNINQRHRHQRTRIVFATDLLASGHVLRWGSHREQHAPLRGRRPARSRALASLYGSQLSRSALLARTAPAARDRGTLIAHATVPRVAQPRAVLRAAGAALLPRRGAAKNHDQRVWHNIIAVSDQAQEYPAR